MSMVEIQKPHIVRITYHQEEDDPILGFPVRAYFDFDLDNYRMHISSNCGDATFHWGIEKKSIYPFLKVMARINKNYVKFKLYHNTFAPYEIDIGATIDSVEQRINDCILFVENEEYFTFDQAKIEKKGYAEARRHLDDLRYDLDHIVPNPYISPYQKALDDWIEKFVPDSWFDYESAVSFEPHYRLKPGTIILDDDPKLETIIRIFGDFIQPKIKEILRGEEPWAGRSSP